MQRLAIAARDKSRAAEFAKKHNIPKVLDSYKALIESKDVDVIYIGALNPDHYQLTKMCLENGKHIFTRIPCVRKEINSGKLGDVQYVEANFGEPISDVERLVKKKLGGSAVLDLGIYVLQLAQFVFKDEPIKVTATGEVNEDGVDVVDTIILEYTGGRRAVLNLHTRVRLLNNATIAGTKGRVTLLDPIPYNFENSAGLVYEALEVARCIKAGLLESPRMSHKESLLLAKLEDTVRKQVGVHYDEDDMEFP
ncbi:oxidoreductase family, NAD-binding rossmann fold domain-containing protein [Phthorimaea operculella]|nr:oxidoreductase family, NAD-binding rossmann fold domain-containing protein [Phthorimaea operculella]